MISPVKTQQIYSVIFNYMFRQMYLRITEYTGRFIIFSVIINIYNKKTKGPTLMELFIAKGKLKKVFFFFDN